MGAMETFISTLNTLQSASPLVEQIATLGDGVHEETVLLNYLTNAGRVPFKDGSGYVAWNIQDQMRYAETYSGGSGITLNHPESLKPMVLPKVYYSIDVSYHRTDLLQNKGSKNRMINYISYILDEAKTNFGQTLELDLLGTGTLSADGRTINGTGASIAGLQLLIEQPTTSATPAATYGNRTRTTSTTYMNNQSFSLATTGSLNSNALRRMMSLVTHGKNPSTPTLIMCNHDDYDVLWNAAKSEKWTTSEGPAKKAAYDFGFPESMTFGNAMIVPNKAMTATTSGGLLSTEISQVYFINADKGCKLFYDPEDDVKLEGEIKLADQHSIVQHLFGTYQLVGLSPRLLGAIYVP